MSQKVANSTCVSCHIKFPRTQMKVIRVKEKTGKTGKTWSIGRALHSGMRGQKKRKTTSARIYGGRNTYSLIKKWYCTECLVKDHPSTAIELGVESAQQKRNRITREINKEIKDSQSLLRKVKKYINKKNNKISDSNKKTLINYSNRLEETFNKGRVELIQSNRKNLKEFYLQQLNFWERWKIYIIAILAWIIIVSMNKD